MYCVDGTGGSFGKKKTKDFALGFARSEVHVYLVTYLEGT